MKYSLQDLSFYHLKKIFKKEPSADLKKRNLDTMKSCLNNGWTAEDIMTFINENKDFKQIRNTVKKSECERNLIDPSKYYYHNLLRIYPETPTVSWDINLGTFTVEATEYFLETRASINLMQIIEYYISLLGQYSNNIEVNRYKGSMKHLISKYGVEQTLFMIDATYDLIKSNSISIIIKSPVQISEYISYAKEKYENRKNEIILAGDDKIVYKKRVFSN